MRQIAVSEAEVARFLGRPASYAGRVRSIERIETHFAWVFLTERFAYKLKRRTHQACMDYRTLRAREWGCREELRLNRRLAASVYLAVLPVLRTRSGELSLSRGVEVVDWVVKMRRLPAARMLDRALRDAALTDADCERVARRLAVFHRAAVPRPLSGARYLRRLTERIAGTARELCARDLGLDRRGIAQVLRAQRRLLAREAQALARRGRTLVEGHGDLRPEHVFVGSRGRPACVIDCLEFDADLRRLDPAEELAFLLLESRRIPHGEAAALRLTERCHALRGDAVPEPVMQFYLSVRASTRAQLAAWHIRDPQFAGEHARWRARAESYLADALRSARSSVPGGQRESRGDRGLPEQMRRSAWPSSAPTESTVSFSFPPAA